MDINVKFSEFELGLVRLLVERHLEDLAGRSLGTEFNGIKIKMGQFEGILETIDQSYEWAIAATKG